ncbi:hypothetical protein BP5796_12167 [Coleophoma crateriformis]|uniref:Uncharacterized protein n=1 Tax=Coleophoma crateriformis TaxID=565419 RepID=A0A3D8QBL7_9HELO|nr:hypothetical protein BP5796_12167 [Coleophoma crateriformis]
MDGNVYLGLWTNWSNGIIWGATLTTTRADGNFLIAFTGFLVPFVASRFWSIICLVFHTYFSTSEPRDAIYHQRQVILRNSSSPDSGLILLLRLFWAWRNTSKASKRSSRLLPIILLSICCISAFTVAGGLSSKISSAPGDKVLLRGDHCGQLQIPTNISDIPEVMSVLSERVMDAALYARQCYSANSSGLLDCDKFVVQSLPMASWDNNTACPFDEGICRSNTSNLLLDTGYIDSNNDLGLNAPEVERFAMRYVLQCAPLVTDGFTNEVVAQNKTFVTYNYGPRPNRSGEDDNSEDFTKEVETLSSQYPSDLIATDSVLNYQLSVTKSKSIDGNFQINQSDFDPIPQLFRSNADLTLIFLSGNGVRFFEPMDDDWYRATLTTGDISFVQTQGNVSSYIPAGAASPMGCLEQWQWCNSAYPRESGCGPLASKLDSLFGAAPMFNLTENELNFGDINSATAAGSRLYWITSMEAMDVDTVRTVLSELGATSLSSQSSLIQGIQYPLPQNQWQLDVTNWFNIVLATIQAQYVFMALGDPDLEQFEVFPSNDAERQLCSSQKIRSTSYTSFSLFGLLFTYITGFLIIIISFVFEPALAYVQKRRKCRDYASIEWSTNAALQLHRLAQEELGIGTWSGCTDIVPVTKEGDILATLDISDLEHPVYYPPGDITRDKSKARSSIGVISMDNVESANENSSVQDSTNAQTIVGDDMDENDNSESERDG